MAEAVVGLDRPVEAGMPPVVKPPVGADLRRQIAAAVPDQLRHVSGVERRYHPAAGIKSVAVQRVDDAIVADEHPFGREQPDRALIGEMQGAKAMPFRRIDTEISFVQNGGSLLRTTVEHGIGVDLCFQKGVLEIGIERNAEAKIIALDILQPSPERAPRTLLDGVDPVDAQPASVRLAARQFVPGALRGILGGRPR